MKRIFQVSAIAAIALSLTSCGLPMAMARSAGRVVNTAASMAGGG